MNNKTNLALVTFVAAIFAATIVIATTISIANAIAGGTGTTTTVKGTGRSYNYFCDIHPWMTGVVTVK